MFADKFGSKCGDCLSQIQTSGKLESSYPECHFCDHKIKVEGGNRVKEGGVIKIDNNNNNSKRRGKQ